MEIVLIIVAIVVVVGASLGFVVAARRRRGDVLEPPPETPRVTRSTSTAVAEPPTIDEAGVDEALREAVEEAVAPAEAEAVVAEAEAIVAEAPPEAPVKPRFRDRLTKARGLLSGYVGSLVGRGKIDDETWEELEEALIRADVGVQPTQELLEHLRQRVKDEGLTDGQQLLDALKVELKERLSGFDLDLRYAETPPSVWLFVGVNGVGKTTTIGKLGRRETDEGHHVLMAAGDTFRAAAAEQLGMWAERADAGLVRGAEGGDPSAVIFDAIESASARDADLVLADTAGRLHTKVNLMEELRKVRRVAEKGAGTVTEVLLVLDATTGQNGLVQARQFTEAVELTGVVLTKLDGSAKGGIVVAIQSELGIPVKLVGLGEGVEDLVAFDPDEFVEALFS
jgi:fused signal recognition particle receptor